MARRLGIYVQDDTFDKVQELCKRLRITQGNLFEAVVLCMTDEELMPLIERLHKTRAIERSMHGAASAELMRRIKGLSADKLQQVLDSIDQISKS